jgi:hypothetical protein
LSANHRKQQAILTLVAALLWLTPYDARSSSSASASTAASPDAQRVKTGHFTYRSFDHGKTVGKGEIAIAMDSVSGNYTFSEDFDFSEEFEGYRSQRWESVATSAFDPISAKLSFLEKSGYTPVFDLKYAEGKVSGFSVERATANGNSQNDSQSPKKRTVNASLPKNTYDQRIDWAVVLGCDLDHQKQFEFNVYDPNTGVSHATAELKSLEHVQVAEISIEAYRVIYRIEKLGGTETYQVLVSQTFPHILLREEFPNGTFDTLISNRD